MVRGDTIAAHRAIARVVYADTVEAARVQVPDVRRDNSQLWQTQVEKADLAFNELRADVIYTRRLRVGDLQAAQVFARDFTVTSSAMPSTPPANSPGGPGTGGGGSNQNAGGGDQGEGNADGEKGKDGEEGEGKGKGQGKGNGNGDNGNGNGNGQGNGKGKGGDK